MPETDPVPTLYDAPSAAHSDAVPVGEHAEATHEGGIHVALKAEQLGTFYGLPITNTLVTSWVAMAILIVAAYFVGRRASMVPGKVQLMFEEVITFVRNFMTETLESEKVASKYLPLLLTIFFFAATGTSPFIYFQF